MRHLLLLAALWPSPALALVASPGEVSEGRYRAEIKAIRERGKVEPTENPASFQRAAIDIYRLSLSRGLKSPDFGQNHFLRLDYQRFTSGREEALGQLFYEADRGQSLSLTYGFHPVRELSHSLGIYASVSPLISFNKGKFSVPRVDLFALGVQSGLELSNSILLETLLHFGSGIPGSQNSYLAFTQTLGLRLQPLLGVNAIVRAGPYAEFDLRERTDSTYQNAFPSTQSGRILAAKVGISASTELKLSSSTFANLGYIQKLAGYDAPATNAAFASVGALF
jgi:hypothetical protein